MIYLDIAATSYPKPESVKKEIVRCLDIFGGNPGRSSHRLAMLSSEKVYECRSKLRDFFNAQSPEDVVFTYNATYALNMAIKTEYREKSHILISDMEHNSVYRPIYNLQKEEKCEFDVFSTDGDVLKNISSLIRKNTDMLVCTHVSNVSGRILPIEEIGKLCQKRGIYFILDASQSAGHFNIDIEKIKCDAFCAPSHKGLFGIGGAGFVIFSKRRCFRTFIEGGSGVNSASPVMSGDIPEMYEGGTLSVPAIGSLSAGIQFIESVGIDEIARRETTLRSFLVERLENIKGITVEDKDKPCSSAVSFYSDKIPTDIIGQMLDEKGICARTGLHCSPLAHKTLKTQNGSVRASIGYFNTVRDIDTFTNAIKEITI